MGKVEHISREMVRGFRETIDFYYWRGKPCMRLWPRKSNAPATPQQLAARQWFVSSRKQLRLMDETARCGLRLLCVGRSSAWLDFFTANYIRFWSVNSAPPPVVYDVVQVE